MSVRVRVCFVCLGNICRSPTAEAVFVRAVERAGLSDRFHIDSAGTGDWHVGEPAHHDTRRTAEQRGVRITHRARQFVRADFERFDLVLAMDRSNAQALHRLAGGEDACAKVRMFRDFVGGEAGLEVPDPYYTGEFDRVFDICEEAAAALLEHLRREHAL